MKKSLLVTTTVLGSLLISSPALAANAEHTVKKGDTLWKISQNNNMSVSDIKELNNLKTNFIAPGQKLKLDEKQNEDTYTVKSGDTLYKIAKSHNTTINRLLEMNPDIERADLIFPGEVIKFNDTQSVAASNPTKKVTVKSETKTESKVTSNDSYVIKKGDTLGKIAKRNNTTIDTLLSSNPELSKTSILRIGQAISLKQSTVSSDQAKSKSVTTSKVTSSKKEAASTTTVKTEEVKKQETTVKTEEAQKQTTVNTSSSSDATAVISAGEKYLGASYRFGASTSQTDAFDCSSFTWRAFKDIGVDLPRTSVAQSNVGTPVSLNNLQKGDLVFFDTDYDGTINHVGIYAGNGKMINSASTYGVSYADINEYYWEPRMVKATRVL